MIRVRVWYAGELERSGNIFFHDSRFWSEENLILAKRCFLVRGVHDLATRLQFCSVSDWSCKLSTM